MFPDPCGAQFELEVAAGADPAAVVPDDFHVARGGASPLPPAGVAFSGAVGPTQEQAAAAVPHGQVRFTTVWAIRVAGGTVVWEPELSRHQTWNRQHVNITEVGQTSFSGLTQNPVPRADRIDGS